MISPSRLLPVLIAITAAITFFSLPSTAGAIVQPLFSTNDTLLGVRNDDGDWWVSTVCQSSGNNTLGPGYVYKLTRNGHNYVDDYFKPIVATYAGVNFIDVNGGLGSFSWQHARGGMPLNYFEFSDGRPEWGPVNAWPVSTRICAGNYPGAYPLFGVSSSSVTESPGVHSDGVYGYGITVDVRTPWQNPIVRLIYTYRFYDSVVKVWIRAQTFCGPVCGDGRWDYVKEPKFSAEAAPFPDSAFSRMQTFAEDGTLIPPDYLGGTFPPTTAQYADNARAGVRFVQQQTGNPVCNATTPCLNVVARSYPPGTTLHLPTGRWEQNNPDKGLDYWAAVAAGETCGSAANPQCVNPVDSDHEGGQWGCNGGDPAAQLQRRWESGGNGYSPFPFLGMFHGWEGGRGPYDCEPLSRRFPGPGWEFSTQLQFSINAGWDTQN